MSTRVLQTQRLTLRHFDLNDAAFIVELLNEPSWLQHIGDKGIKTSSDAERYIQDGPLAMYARLGFGLYLVELTDSGEPLGMCGLIKRDTLQDVDLGFAFLSRFWGNGYAYEAAAAVMSYAATRLRIDRIVPQRQFGTLGVERNRGHRLHQFVRHDGLDMLVVQVLGESFRPEHHRTKDAEYPWLHHVPRS